MKPFWKRKLFLVPVIGSALGALGVPFADDIVAIGAVAYKAAQGHSPAPR